MNYSKKEILEHLLQWEEALLSDKYPQGRQWLRTEEGFCCLGVACDVSGLGKWEEPSDNEKTQCGHAPFIYRVGQFESDTALLPPKVRDYYGFGRVHPTFEEEDDEGPAGWYNDSLNYSFPQIAALLRNTYITPLEEELANE